MIDSWNLVAAGPSRSKLCDFHLIPDAPVVTVNRAMDISERGITVDFCAFSDGPGMAWEKCNLEKLWKPSMVLWVSMQPTLNRIRPQPDMEEIDAPGPPLLKLWDRALPASAGFRLMPFGNIEDVGNPGTMRSAFTTFCALRRILEYKPKRIRILCMDMMGSWIEGMSEAECHDYDMERNNLDRWKHERVTMERVIAKARGEGIVVELVTP